MLKVLAIAFTTGAFATDATANVADRKGLVCENRPSDLTESPEKYFYWFDNTVFEERVVTFNDTVESETDEIADAYVADADLIYWFAREGTYVLHRKSLQLEIRNTKIVRRCQVLSSKTIFDAALSEEIQNRQRDYDQRASGNQL